MHTNVSFLGVFEVKNYFSKLEMALWSSSVVLIVLWIMASLQDVRYLSVVVCFAAFLVNDIYGYISWQKMKVKQSENR